jgi:hypothetical protein
MSRLINIAFKRYACVFTSPAKLFRCQCEHYADRVLARGSAASLKPELAQAIFKNSVRTAEKTPHFAVTKINRLTAV